MVSSEILQGTLFSWVYSLFRISGDEELIQRMTVIAIVYTIIVGFVSLVKAIPYGKHLTDNTFTMNARASWIVSSLVEKNSSFQVL